MLLVDYPLPITHQYRMEPGGLDELADGMAGLDMAVLKRVPSFSMSRWPTLPEAPLLLEILGKELPPSERIGSSCGTAERLRVDALDGPHHRREPLNEAARGSGSEHGRSHGPGPL